MREIGHTFAKLMKIKPFPKAEDIHTVAVPLPHYPDLITANAYAVGKDPLTLIDTGPKFPGALSFIKERLRRAGFHINDIARIIVTHGHVDHFGLAAGICQAAGHPIEIYIHEEDKWRVSSDNFQEAIWSEEAKDLMVMVGMPQREIKKVRKRLFSLKELCDPLDKVYTMDDGDEFVGDNYNLKVIHTPGHTPGSCCLYETRQKVLFSGDNIIKHITPNPLIEIRRDRLRNPNYQSLREYLNSLDKLTNLDVRFVFPGHGEYVEDLRSIISTFKEHHRQRLEHVWNALRKKRRPLYYLIDDVFPNIPENDIFLAISEILVHLEMLVNEERASLVTPGPPALYQAL